MDNDNLHLEVRARRAAEEAGFDTEFSSTELEEAQRAASRQAESQSSTRTDIDDWRSLLWSSIDNPESRDLDQLEVAERLANDDIRVLVAIADVDALVPQGSLLDRHAALNTTSLYTESKRFRCCRCQFRREQPRCWKVKIA
jgi:exoribonuclease-2